MTEDTHRRGVRRTHSLPAPGRLLLLSLPLAVGLALAAAVVAGRAGADPAGCNPNHPSACLYTSDLSYEVGTADGLELIDADRNDHRIPILVRFPIGADGPRPIVIWNHGGTPREGGKYDSEEWGNLLAAAGYVVIHPSRVHPASLTQDQIDECAANGFDTDPDTCNQFLGGFRYGAENNAHIISRLIEVETSAPALAGLLDHEKIAVAGHSGGSTSVHINAGAWQQFEPTTERYTRPLTEPIAYLATGPQGPMSAGFPTGFQSRDGDAGWAEHSWTGIEAPYMLITGVGDETNEPPESRTAGFLTSVGNGNKVLLWDTEPDAQHETMNIHKCDTPTQADHCEWIGSAGLAYFDAVMRDRRKAQKWLASDALEVLTDGALELHRR